MAAKPQKTQATTISTMPSEEASAAARAAVPHPLIDGFTEALQPTPFAPPVAPATASRSHIFPGLSLGLTALLFAFVFFPPVRDNPGLVWSFSGVASALLVWQLILWSVAKRQGRAFRIEFVPVKSHYIQAAVQFSIMLYWGWYWPNVYAELPLIVGQTIFLYALDALLSWSRGRSWRIGFGPLPIVVSTNLLLWFKHDWYIYQFLMLATGALAKQFITWNRDGKKTHIFNPSAFGQFLFAVVLIATGTTNDYTWGRDIASTFDTPHMLIVIFLGGLIVQSFFHVTLMTFSAVAALYLLNLVYTEATGLYFFVNINIAAPIFLGVHLLLTDPATSPRTNMGRVLFGALYGLGYFVLFRVLDIYGVPLFWDKLLPVPILNLAVPLIDRFIRSGIIGKANRAWETALQPRFMNVIHMACWIALFATMFATGFIEAPHPGNSIPFWKKAFQEGKQHAGHSLVMVTGAQAEGGASGEAFNELGLICMEGKIVKENHGTAAKYFARACELGNFNGCANVASQFLFLNERRSDEDVAHAFELLEQDCNGEGYRRSCLLVAMAYETGRGRPWNKRRAIELYERCGLGNLYACKGLARIGLAGTSPPYDLSLIAPIMKWAAEQGDAESCWYLAYMFQVGNGMPRDEHTARMYVELACKLKLAQACDALQQPQLPPFAKPIMVVPNWSTAFPVQ